MGVLVKNYKKTSSKDISKKTKALGTLIEKKLKLQKKRNGLKEELATMRVRGSSVEEKDDVRGKLKKVTRELIAAIKAIDSKKKEINEKQKIAGKPVIPQGKTKVQKKKAKLKKSLTVLEKEELKM